MLSLLLQLLLVVVVVFTTARIVSAAVFVSPTPRSSRIFLQPQRYARCFQLSKPILTKTHCFSGGDFRTLPAFPAPPRPARTPVGPTLTSVHQTRANEQSLEAALAAGSPHFGDIMGRGEGHRGGQEGSLLRHFDAMERVVLTANGNLQRVIRLVYHRVLVS